MRAMPRLGALWMVPLAALLLGACGGKLPAEHLSDAQAHAALFENNAAVIELKNAIQKDPQLAQARALLADLYLQTSDFPGALKEAERALDLGLDDAANQLNIYRAKLGLGRYAEVIGALEEESALPPEFAVVLGDAYFMAGDIDKAKSLVGQGLHLPAGLLGMARVAFSENDLQRAQSYLTRAVEMDQRLTQGWLLKGEVELAQGQYSAAREAYTQAQRLPSGNVAGTMGVVRTHLMQEDIAAAATGIEALVKRVGDFAPAQYLLGLVRFRQNDLDAALGALRNVQKTAPDHPPTLFLIGVVLAQQGELNQSVDNLRRFVSTEPNNLSALKVLASVYGRQQDFESVRDLLAIGAQRGSDPQIWALLGNAHLQLGEFGQATEAFEKAVSLAPDMAPFRNQLALSLLSSGEPDAALGQLESAMDLDGDQFQSDYIMVMYRLQQRDIQGATASVTQILTKSPESPIGHHLQGAILQAQGDLDGARQSYTTALQHDPEFFPARQNLARIAEGAEGGANVGQAREIYAQGLDANPDDEDAALALVDFHHRHGEVDEALALLAKTLERHPESVRARLGQVRLLVMTRRIDEATAAVNRLVQLAPDVPDALFLQAQVNLLANDITAARATTAKLQTLRDAFTANAGLLAALGELQLRTGNLTLARNNLEAAMALEDGSTNVRMVLARLELAEGRPAQAQMQVDKLRAEGLDNDNVNILQADVHLASRDVEAADKVLQPLAAKGVRPAVTRYALLLTGQQKFDDAADLLRAYLKDNPGDTGVKMNLANVGIQSGQNNQAKTVYEAMMPSDDPVLLNNLAWIYFEQADDRAEQVARRAQSILPDNPDINDTLGWILTRKGAVAEGLQYLRDSARARPDNPTIQYHLAQAYHLSGNSERARQALQKALQNSTQFDGRDEAQALLQQLQ